MTLTDNLILTIVMEYRFHMQNKFYILIVIKFKVNSL